MGFSINLFNTFLSDVPWYTTSFTLLSGNIVSKYSEYCSLVPILDNSTVSLNILSTPFLTSEPTVSSVISTLYIFSKNSLLGSLCFIVERSLTESL